MPENMATVAGFLTALLLCNCLSSAAHEHELLEHEVESYLERGGQLEQRAHKLAAAAAGTADELAAAEAAVPVRAEAEAAYRAAMLLDPFDARAFFNLGHALRAGGPSRTSETIALFETALALEPLNLAGRNR